jgi:hypothetical protein
MSEWCMVYREAKSSGSNLIVDIISRAVNERVAKDLVRQLDGDGKLFIGAYPLDNSRCKITRENVSAWLASD